MIEHVSCNELLQSLSDYVDDSLDETFCSELEQHLLECEDCRVVVNTLRKTIGLYQVTAPAAETPEDVRERLYHRLHLDEFIQKHSKQTQ